MKDRLIPWDIKIKDPPKRLFVEGLYDDYEGFRILLRGEKPKSKILKVTFEDYLSYRNTDESNLLKVWNNQSSKLLGRIFYKVQNSSYIDFFHEMTEMSYLNWEVTHYAIYTIEDCIDILGTSPPKVFWST